ncbi:hypothetical protein HU200_047586 [Digitaria exilis]|uniref:MADS-box domain-containing protein n=1 Tax=Digitaria exilis TaxID=1010633 RepID=A0A835AX10_9POAL|nr:hypothetical protein HU200_047586 [Digitaria exilis]
MPRRVRRSGVRFIEDDRDRGLTFFKRRSGIFKAASDLSTLTGARVVVVLESERERFSSFGTPAVGPIIDAFLSGGVPAELNNNDKQIGQLTNLQNELFQVEKDKAMEEKMKKEHTMKTKVVQGTSMMSKYVYGKAEHLNSTELFEMYRELSRTKQEIEYRLLALLREDQVEVGGQQSNPSSLQAIWWHPTPSNVVRVPKHSPLAPSQALFQHHPWSYGGQSSIGGCTKSKLGYMNFPLY